MSDNGSNGLSFGMAKNQEFWDNCDAQRKLLPIPMKPKSVSTKNFSKETYISEMENYGASCSNYVQKWSFLSSMDGDSANKKDEVTFTRTPLLIMGKQRGTRRITYLDYQVVPLVHRLNNSQTPLVYASLISSEVFLKRDSDVHLKLIKNWLSSFSDLKGSEYMGSYNINIQHRLRCVVVLPDSSINKFNQKFRLGLYKHGWDYKIIDRDSFLRGDVDNLATLTEADCLFVPMLDPKVNAIVYTLQAGGSRHYLAGVDFTDNEEEQTSSSIHGKATDTWGNRSGQGYRKRRISASISELDFNSSFSAQMLSQTLLDTIVEAIVVTKLKALLTCGEK